MIDKSFLEKIESMSGVEVMDISDRKYTSKKIHPVLDPVVENITVHTLTGLVDFFGTLAPEANHLFHVRDFNNVAIVSELFGPNKQRDTFIVSESYQLNHRLNEFLPVEDFIVYLQSMFVQDDYTEKIMKVVGNLTQGNETNVADDGITQRVTAKAGITRVEVVDLPNPVFLRPFRTFMDIEQPGSKFVLRIKADADRGPRCALFEADGGAWKSTAIATIKDYLENCIAGAQVVA